MNLAVISLVLRRCHPRHRFKHPVEMGQAGKSSFPADLGDVQIRFHKFALGIHNTCDIQILDHSTIHMPLKFTAQVIRADIKCFCQLFLTDVFLIVFMDVANDLAYPVKLFFFGRFFPLYLKYNGK